MSDTNSIVVCFAVAYSLLFRKDVMKKRIIHHLEYPSDVDKELIPLLDVLNSIPGVRTRYSCCGHGNDEFYLLLAVSCERAARMVIEKFEKFGFFVDYNGIRWENPYMAPYECDLRVGSWEVGRKKARERKSFILKIRSSIEELVPRNGW